MNKVPSDIEPELEKLAKDGVPLFRTLDKYCKRIERLDVRGKFRVQ